MVIWLIGLSGSGKTTLAKSIVEKTKPLMPNLFLLDGDVIRDIFDNDLDYSLESRRKNANRMSKFCKYLDDQGISVVCSILSIFEESRDWNRKNIKNYYEVFIDTKIEDLRARDSKGLYKKYKQGKIKDVAGEDLFFPIPRSPDLVIDNSKSLDGLLSHSEYLSNKLTS